MGSYQKSKLRKCQLSEFLPFSPLFQSRRLIEVKSGRKASVFEFLHLLPSSHSIEGIC
jgi:hypothetical protein